jgi:hypothetical protein
MRKQGRVREGKGIILNPTIVLEGSRRTIPNANEGDVTVGGKLVANNFPKVGGGVDGLSEKIGSLCRSHSLQGAWAPVNNLSTNFRSRHLFWVCKSFRPSPPVLLT